MSRRAAALPPTERRLAIVRTALDLIRDLGTMPTTRQIAEAAGIAEGTVFRAFDTKERLVDAIVGQAFCPAAVAAGLRTIPLDLPLRERLVAVVRVLQARFTAIFGVMSALGLTAPPADYHEHRGCRAETGHVMAAEQDQAAEPTWANPETRLQSLVEPDAARLTCTPADLVTYLRLLTFSASHPDITGGRTLAPETIVAVVLDGTLVAAARTGETHAAASRRPPPRSDRKAR